MNTAKGGRNSAPSARPSRQALTSVQVQSPTFRRIRCWAICPVADELELEDWMVGQVDG
jgi:hypothetical protein